MMTRGPQSWGRYPKARHDAVWYEWRFNPLPLPAGSDRLVLPYGRGRTYGDSCLNDGQTLIRTERLDKLIGFDPVSGVLKAESGVTLDQLLRFAVPRGFFAPVTPGTRFVTLGGAIANDVHGKNHHAAGSFGHHVRAFELLRSNGERLVCTPTENAELFRATIGGLGLTGLMTWVEIVLKKIPSPWIKQEAIRFHGLEEYLALAAESEANFEYTVAWVDCLAKGAELGRGIFYRGNDATPDEAPKEAEHPRALAAVPIDVPGFFLNRYTMGAFNQVYYRKQRDERQTGVVHWAPFYYPLDAVLGWNKLYGRAGFLQYQFVVPPGDAGTAAIKEILARTERSGIGSFLAVMKTFGRAEAPGLLSFPRPGTTLTLDFPVRPSVFPMLDAFDQIVREAGGALYPAKDARMSRVMFESSFPQVERFAAFVDPRFSSSFWRRVRS